MSNRRDFKNKNTKFTGSDGIVVPNGTTSGVGPRPGMPDLGTLRYNTTTGLAEFYTATGWAGVDAPPVVSSLSGTINENTNSTITITGSGFKTGSIVYITGNAVSNVERVLATTYVNQTSLTAATAAGSVNYVGNATFGVKVLNPSGLSGQLDSAGTVDRDPIWSTASGNIATWVDSGSQSASVVASDPDGTSVTYSLASGSLPGNSSLNSSTGAITSSDPTDIASPTTYSFTIDATSNTQSLGRPFNIIVNPTPDGSASGRAAASADAIKTLTGTTTNGLYWIKPTAYSGSAVQVYCLMDGTAGSKAWTLAFNFISSSNTGFPSSEVPFYTSSFWTTQDGNFNTGNGLTANQKTTAYGYLGHSEILFLLHNKSNTSWRGWGRYAYTASFQGQTLFQLCTGTANKTVTSGRAQTMSGSNSGAQYVTTTRPQTRGGDQFIDPNFTAGGGTSNNANDNLVFNASGTSTWWSNATYANTRITTSAGQNNSSYPYTFGGIGGQHFNESGWGNDYGFTPIYPYCGGPYAYGTSGTATGGVINYVFPGTSMSPAPTQQPVSSSCHDGHGGGFQDVAMAVFVR
jgi:hypothetical protein